MTTISYTLRDMAGYEPCRSCGISAPDVLPFFPAGVVAYARGRRYTDHLIDWLCMACMCSALIARLILRIHPIEPTPRDQFWWAMLVVYEHTLTTAS